MVSMKKTMLALSFLIICIASGCNSKGVTPPQNDYALNYTISEKSEVPEILYQDKDVASDLSLKNLQFTEKENQFSIEDIIIDKSYSIENVGTDYVSGGIEDSLSELFSGCSLIGYDSEYIYLMHGEEDEFIISRVDYVSKNIEIGIYSFRSKLMFSKYIQDDCIYIGYSELSEDGNELLSSTLKRLDIKNGIDKITETVLFQTNSSKYPAVVYSDEHIVINYVEDNSYILSCIDYETQTITEIYRAEYSVDESARYTGKVPVYGNSTGQGVYFQLISLNNELFDFEGTQSLYYYSFANDSYEQVLNLSDKVTYVNGNMEIIIISNYSVDDPRTLTGKIISIKDNTITAIPNTDPTNGIIDSVINGNLIFAYSYRNLFVYDISEKTFSTMDIEKDGNSGVGIFNSTFGLLKKEEDIIRFSIVQFRDKS